MTCSQIWLSALVDGRQPTYLTKIEKRKIPGWVSAKQIYIFSIKLKLWRIWKKMRINFLLLYSENNMCNSFSLRVTLQLESWLLEG
jgi:hypothetical protein